MSKHLKALLPLAGGDYTEMGLAATVVASSFGKLVQPGGDGKVAASPADLAKACLLMVTNNVGSLAMLHAKAAGVKRILFAGSFLHGNKVRGPQNLRVFRDLIVINFWSLHERSLVGLDPRRSDRLYNRQ